MQQRDTQHALILGVTGGYGQAMGRELARQGWSIRALVRDRARAEKVLADTPLSGAELLEGDVLDQGALARAARGAEVIVFGINVPYGQWSAVMEEVTKRVAQVAVDQGATIAFAGNVYPFAPGQAIAHDTPMHPPNPLGQLRQRMEHCLAKAADRGARLVILRGGDFFGTHAQNSWMHHILSKARCGGALQMPGHRGIRHGWAYLPDFARAHVALLQMRHELPAAATFHFRGHVITEEELLDALGQVLGGPPPEGGPSSLVVHPAWRDRVGRLEGPCADALPMGTGSADDPRLA